jgi:hypothetical protein
MPPPQEKMPQQKLDAMLDAFQQANKTTTTDPGRELHELIEKTPELKTSFLKQIGQGHLDGFQPLNRTGLSGAYIPDTKKMEVPIDQLNDAAAGKQGAANSLRFTLAHEIDHARTHDVSMAEKKQFYKNVEQIASSPNTPPHDYTNLVKTFNDQPRAHGVRAEIAGFNTLADYVRKQNPHASREIACWCMP